nr:pentapeptide repeat-containing protein [Actinacidiphila acididurans]
MDTTGLTADCANCFGLCCVALAFTRPAGFAADKAAGEPCGHLSPAHTCDIHGRLRESGWPGCTVYECFGAGQKVSQVTFGGIGWRESADKGAAMFAALPVMRQLHELLWYLAEVRSVPAAAPLHSAAAAAAERIEALTGARPQALADLDVAAERAVVGELLGRVSTTVRDRVPGRRPDRRGADLAGARLRGAGLRGASLRGSLLIGADLRGADLRETDLLGADLRDTDLRGADLTGALFLTGPQLAAARGDAATRLPAHLARPPHWTA